MQRLILLLALVAFACESTAADEQVKRSPYSLPDAATPADDDDAAVDDPYLWLEDISGEKSLTWVKERNTQSKSALETDRQRALQKRLLSIYDSQDRLPSVSKRGAYLYNFWQDEQHARGVLRRTSLDEYKKPQPAWEVVLDIDALATAENENWVWSGASWLEPSYERALISLSRGGGDAAVVRELNVATKTFVADGFNLPEAKSDVSWKDADTIFVGTDFGPGSQTSSGYSRITKEWKRGTPLSAAKTLFEAQPDDVVVSAYRDWHQGRAVDVIERWVTFFENEVYILDGEQVTKLDKPNDVEVSFFADFVLFRTLSAWQQNGQAWPSGALLAAPLAAYRAGQTQLQAVYTPAPNRSLSSFSGTKNALLLNVLEDVHSRLFAARFQNNAWAQTELPVSGLETIEATAYDADEGDQYWQSTEGFIEPLTLALGDLNGAAPEVIRRAPTFFDASGLEVTQHFATSADGTPVPYFQVAKANLPLTGDHPVYLTGYGGFEVSLTPGYIASAGAAWLERGGVFVQANIRGGGEYGPAWHDAALKQNRQRAYDDFIAIGTDLIARKVTRPERLGIEGGSNGGLLMGVMLTQRPDLWGAVVCAAPLLDMKRYHLLLAGASWMGEYGDPDVPEEWAAIAEYSPYQNVRPGVEYPPVLFTTSTLDDRVHPGHARKMAARMLEQGHDILFYENTEGGHAGAANNEQSAYMNAIEYEFLYQRLKF
jgi:prolyl oligopeptidase